MTLMRGLEKAMGNALKLNAVIAVEQILRISIQAPLVFFHCQNIVAAFLNDGGGLLRLAAEGIDGHDTAGEFQSESRPWSLD